MRNDRAAPTAMSSVPTPEEALSLAWTYCAPGRSKDVSFPRGFWPDVARVAMEMFTQQTTSPELSFQPTRCTRGNSPEPAASQPKRSAGKISAAQKAANTAALMAAIRAGEGK
jgi:hypothetical protein